MTFILHGMTLFLYGMTFILGGMTIFLDGVVLFWLFVFVATAVHFDLMINMFFIEQFFYRVDENG